MRKFSLLKDNDQPQITSQIIVQSEKEKQLLKQVRKEEKKLLKVASKMDGGLNDNEEENFDPVELRAKKIEALTAMRAPLFPPKKKYKNYVIQEKFPFVFDSKLSTSNCPGE